MRDHLSPDRAKVFATGGTGYLGRALIPELIARGLSVRALVRRGSESKLPLGCEWVVGDALDSTSFNQLVSPAETFIQLVGVPHPSPAKAAQFQQVDFASIQASVRAALENRINHFVYVSVAQPAPVMKAYQAVRAAAEALIAQGGLNASILRPWYILGPGHRWPYLLLPIYWICARVPATRGTARRLGLVSLRQMVEAIVWCVENPAKGIRLMTVTDIRAGRRTSY